jgi:hypothetical protein
MNQNPRPPQPHPDLPETWPSFKPLMIAHDVGRVRDRSTAVVGGGSPFQSSILGLRDFFELPQGLYGSARASALAEVDRHYLNNAVIVADLSNDTSYGEFLFETFGRRLIGLQITAHGDGTNFERRPVRDGAMLVYNVGRTYLLNTLQPDGQQDGEDHEGDSERAFAQLNNLQTEFRDSGTVYTTMSGQHDDLGISCCMLAWALHHPHMRSWVSNAFFDRQPRRPQISARTAWAATT